MIENFGVRPCAEKIEAVKNAPAPRNQIELKVYLGMLAFYLKFIPHASVKLKPLYERLRKKGKLPLERGQRKMRPRKQNVAYTRQRLL